MLPKRRANKSKPVTLRLFSHWPRRIGSVGAGEPQGVSGARCGLRHDWVGQCRKVKSEEKEREGGSCWKSGGGRVRLYTQRSAGLADNVWTRQAARAVTRPLKVNPWGICA